MTSETGAPDGEPKKKSKIRRAWSLYRWFDRFRGWSDWYNWLSGFLQTKAGVAAAVGSAAAVTTATAVVVHTVMTETPPPPPPPPPVEIAAPEPVRETKSSVIFAIEGRDKAGRRGAFDVVVAQKEFLWVRKSSDEIEKSGVVIPTADIAGQVFDAYIRLGLEEAKEIIAVGTASQEGDAKEETERAGKRAERTAEILASVVDAEIPIWTLEPRPVPGAEPRRRGRRHQLAATVHGHRRQRARARYQSRGSARRRHDGPEQAPEPQGLLRLRPRHVPLIGLRRDW